MITKQRFIEELEKCLKTEQSAIPLYAKHVNNTLFLSGFTKSDSEKISKVMKELMDDSKAHSDVLEGLIDRAKRSERDVY